MQRLEFDRLFMQQIFLTILNTDEKLAVRIDDVLWTRLFFKRNLHVHFRMQFLIRNMDGHFLAADFAQKSEELTPKSVELLRLRIFRQTPAPEILNREHGRQTGAVMLRGHENSAPVWAI